MGETVGQFRWVMVLLLIGPITFVMSLDRTAMVVAAPVIQREFHFTLVQMSFLLTAFSWTYAALQVPAGWLAERIGPRRSLFAANALWSVFTAATPLGFSFLSFSAIRFALGIGQSADWPSSVLAIKRWFPTHERAKANSVLLGALYLGPIVAAPLTTWVMLTFGWPVAFYAFGAVGILLGLGWLWGFRDRPERHPMVSAAEAAHIAAGQGGDPASSAPGAFVRCLGSGQFWAIGVEYFFLVLIQSFYTTWLPTYLVISRHLSLKAMGIFRRAAMGRALRHGVCHGSDRGPYPAVHGIDLARARAARDRGLHRFGGGADRCLAHAGDRDDDGPALHLARRDRAHPGLDLVLDAGSRPRRDRDRCGLDEFLGQCRRRRRPRAHGFSGALDRHLVGCSLRHRARGRGRRCPLDFRPPRASARAPC